MLVAQTLRKKNVAEYLLYMWQVEDLIRANQLDIDRIDEAIVAKYDRSEEEKKQVKEWYESLIDMMRQEDVQQEGHLAINNNTLLQLTELHSQLLRSPKHGDYSAIYYKTLPYIVELRAKSGNKQVPELETCFTALYGFMLMNIQGKEISGETQAAVTQISNLIRLLATKYHQNEVEALEL